MGKFRGNANFCYFHDYPVSHKIFYPWNFQLVTAHALHNMENTNVLKLKRQQQLQEHLSITICSLMRTPASIPHYCDPSLLLWRPKKHSTYLTVIVEEKTRVETYGSVNRANAAVKRFSKELGTGLPNISIDVISSHTRLHTKMLHIAKCENGSESTDMC